MSAPAWERVPERGDLIYWLKRLPDGSFLTVTRLEDGFVWRHRGPESTGTGAAVINLESDKVGSVRAAKDGADRWLAKVVPALALVAVKTAAGALGQALERRDAAVLDALLAGATSRAVAEAAGMSAPGVLAIRKRLEAGR